MEPRDKKERILSVAERHFAEKGLLGTTITEIASEAKIVDSEIYQFFKSKEDLLFAIPYKRMQEVLSLLGEHLEGITDARSRLKKLIWFHLRNQDLHPEYAKILLLDCRSSRNFYSTPAYELIRTYTGVLSSILSRGVGDKAFRSDMNISMARDVILGTLDWESISWLSIGEIEENAADLEDIMLLVNSMIAYREKEVESKSQRILRAAKKIFAEKGYLKAKITDIARTAGVSEGTIYEYFKNKSDLLPSIANAHFESDPDVLYDSLFNIDTPLKKLRRFISYYYSDFINDKSFLEVFLLQIQLSRAFYQSAAYEKFRNYSKLIETIIEEGKSDGSFRRDVNTRVFRNMVLGAFSHLALRWIMFDHGNEFDKIRESAQVTDLLCDAVTPNEEVPSG